MWLEKDKLAANLWKRFCTYCNRETLDKSTRLDDGHKVITNFELLIMALFSLPYSALGVALLLNNLPQGQIPCRCLKVTSCGFVQSYMHVSKHFCCRCEVARFKVVAEIKHKIAAAHKPSETPKLSFLYSCLCKE